MSFDTIKRWIGALTEIGLVLIALGIVVQVLFPGTATFFESGSIIQNIMNLIARLGSGGFVGLIALGVVLWLFTGRRIS